MTSIIVVTLCAFGGACMGVWLLKKRRDSTFFRYNIDRHDLTDCVVLVTGGTSGLGRELCTVLAQQRATVYFTCRNATVAAEATIHIKQGIKNQSAVKLRSLICDLADLESVAACAMEFKRLESKLDVLVNNAGVMGCPYSTTKQGLETQFGVNHLAHAYLTDLLLPMLAKSSSARIVTVTSGYYKGAVPDFWDKLPNVAKYDPLKAYSNSKFANCLHAYQLAKDLRNVDVYAVRPGFVRGTKLGRHFSKILQIVAYPAIWFISRNVKQGTQTLLHCCIEDGLEKGALYSDGRKEEYADIVNDQAALRLKEYTQHVLSTMQLTD